MINPEFVEREGMQLEEEGCLSVPGFNATVRPARARVVKRLDRDGVEHGRRHRTARARVPARDGSPRRPPVRRSPARHQARPHRPEDPEAAANRQMVTSPRAIAFFGTPEFAVPTLRALIDSRHDVVASSRSRIGRRDAATSSAADADESRGARSGRCRCCSRKGSATTRFSSRRGMAPISAWSPPTARSCPTRCSRSRGSGMINVHASLLPAGAARRRSIARSSPATPRPASRSCASSGSSTPGRCSRVATRPIGADETSVEVERAGGRWGAGLLLEVVEQLAAPPSRRSRRTTRARPTRAKITKRKKGGRLGAAGGRDPQPRARPAAVAARLRAHRRPALPDPSHRDGRRGRRRQPGHDRRGRTATDWIVAPATARARILQTAARRRRVMTAREFLAGHAVRPAIRARAVIAPARRRPTSAARASAPRRRPPCGPGARPRASPARRARSRARRRDRHRHAALAGRVRSRDRARSPAAARAARSRSRRHPAPHASFSCSTSIACPRRRRSTTPSS